MTFSVRRDRRGRNPASDVDALAARSDLIADWVARMRAGDARTLGRLISWVENQSPGIRELLGAIHDSLGQAVVVGFTGAPGVGKSSLVNAYTHELRRRARTVGIIAVDPSSPISGGAILGDRIRMGDHVEDSGVFVRSLAARGHLGGLSRAAAAVVDLMDAAGKDFVIVETVGTGQSEVEIAQLADVTVLVCTAGYGDVIQFEKAGILEISDLFAINKSDLPGADRVAAELARMIDLDDVPTRAIVKTCANTREGIVELADRIESAAAALKPTRCARTRRTRLLLAAAASNWLKTRIATLNDERLEAVCERVSRGETSYEMAVREVLTFL